MKRKALYPAGAGWLSLGIVLCGFFLRVFAVVTLCPVGR